MRRRTRGGGHYQYLSNTGYSNGLAMPTTAHYLRGSETALANPTPWARTISGGGCGCKPRKTTSRLVWKRKTKRRRR
jgi:hypothetical protein